MNNIQKHNSDEEIRKLCEMKRNISVIILTLSINNQGAFTHLIFSPKLSPIHSCDLAHMTCQLTHGSARFVCQPNEGSVVRAATDQVFATGTGRKLHIIGGVQSTVVLSNCREIYQTSDKKHTALS